MAAYDSVDQARVLQFKANVTHLYQQKGSKLRGKTREESLTGKAHFYERLGSTAAVLKSTRHADTILLDPIHSRRMVVPADYVWNALVDQQDKRLALGDGVVIQVGLEDGQQVEEGARRLGHGQLLHDGAQQLVGGRVAGVGEEDGVKLVVEETLVQEAGQRRLAHAGPPEADSHARSFVPGAME